MCGNRSWVNVHSILTAVSSKPVGPGKTHQFSALDHALGSHSLHAVFYYERNPFKAFDLDPLRECLSEVLSFYHPITGRLTRGENGNWVVKCNDAGVRILRAKVSVTVDEWLRSADGVRERDLTVWEDMPEDPSGWSPFRIQVNEFEGGGVALGISCSHMHADPTTLTILFKSWTEGHRGQPVAHPPSFSRPLHARTTPTTTANHKPASPYYATKSKPKTSPIMAAATFKFSNSTIDQCLAEIHDSFSDATPFDFLAALFWTRIASLKGQKHNDHHQHFLSICTDFRRRLQDPQLPYGYFGNALHFSALSVNEEDMEFSRLGCLAGLIHRHVSGLKDEEILSAIDWLESQKGEGGKYESPCRMYGPELTCVSMEHTIINGDPPLMYSAIFDGDNKPVHVTYHVGNAEGEGLIMVMPSPEGGLARTVTVTLPEKELINLREDQAILRLEPVMLLNGGL